MRARRLTVLAILANLTLSRCWFTSFPESGTNPNCNTRTYGFLLFSSSSTACDTNASAAAPGATPAATL